MAFAAKHFLARVIATLALRRIAFDRLRIDDGQGRTGAAPRLFPVRHHQMMIDPLHVPAIGQQPPIIVADARRRQVLRHCIPGYAIAQDITDAIHDLAKQMPTRTAGIFGNRQKRFQNGPLFVRQITGISLAAPVIPPAVLLRPNHRIIRQLSYASRYLPTHKGVIEAPFPNEL
jgi:hypothetical protein